MKFEPIQRPSLAALILRNPALVIAWGVSLIIAVTVIGRWSLSGAIGTDFRVYWRTANTAIQWAYSPDYSYPFPYAPTMLLWIKPLAFVPVWPAFFAWVALSAGALAWACRKYLSWSAIALVIASPPVINGLAAGQVSCFLAALMLWACGTDRRFLAGIAFGIVASVKPQLVLVAPLMFILMRDWRAVAGSALSFLTVIAVALLAYGAKPWGEWVALSDAFRDRMADKLVSVPTLAGSAEWWGLPPLPFLIAGIFLGVWLVWACRNSPPLERCAAIGCGSLLAAPYALTYDLAPVVPFLVAMIFARRIIAALAISVLMHPMALLLTAFELRVSAPSESDPRP